MAARSTALPRRRFLQALGAGGALALVGCGTAALMDSSAVGTGLGPHAPPGAPAPEPAPSLDAVLTEPEPAAAPPVIAPRRVPAGPVVGALLPLSGPFAYEGVAFRRGAEVALAELGEREVLRGERLRLEFVDARRVDTSPETEARRLIDAGAAALLISGDEPHARESLGGEPVRWVAPATSAVARLAHEHTVPLLIGHALAEHVGAGGYAFRLGGGAREAAEALAGYLRALDREGTEGRRVALLATDHPTTRAVADLAAAALAAAGFALVSRVDHPLGVDDLSEAVEAAHSAGARLLVACQTWSDGRLLAENLAIAQLNWAAVVGCLNGAFSQPRLAAQLGSRAEELFDVNWAVSADPGAAPAQRLAARFPGEAFGYHHFLGWASVHLLVSALERAGSLDGAALRDALVATDVALRPTAWAGRIRFEAGRNRAAVPPLLQMRDGRARIVAPAALAEREPTYPATPWQERL